MNHNPEIYLAFTITWSQLTDHEKDIWSQLYGQAQQQGRFHHYSWKHWN